MWLAFLATNSCSCNAKVKCAAVNCYYYHIHVINNVLGDREEDFVNVTGRATEEEETPILLEEKENNVRNVRRKTISYSGTVTHMKLL
jgi:hypothetical protein